MQKSRLSQHRRTGGSAGGEGDLKRSGDGGMGGRGSVRAGMGGMMGGIKGRIMGGCVGAGVGCGRFTSRHGHLLITARIAQLMLLITAWVAH